MLISLQMNGIEQDTALLRELAAFTRLTPSKMATEAGLADTTISRAYRGAATTRLSQPTIEKLRARFPEFPGWVKAGVADDRLAFRGFPKQRDDDLVQVAEIDPSFGMGAAIMDEYATPSMRSFSRTWLRQFTDAQPDDLYWARGRGNSMSPTIEEGEPVLIDRRQQTPRDDDLIWAFARGDIGGIKRLRPRSDRVEIISDNDAVRPDVAYDGELHIFGRVIAVVKRL